MEDHLVAEDSHRDDLTSPCTSSSQILCPDNSASGILQSNSQPNMGKKPASDKPESRPYITMEDFLSGVFPWQIGDEGILEMGSLYAFH